MNMDYKFRTRFNMFALNIFFNDLFVYKMSGITISIETIKLQNVTGSFNNLFIVFLWFL